MKEWKEASTTGCQNNMLIVRDCACSAQGFRDAPICVGQMDGTYQKCTSLHLRTDLKMFCPLVVTPELNTGGYVLHVPHCRGTTAQLCVGFS